MLMYLHSPHGTIGLVQLLLIPVIIVIILAGAIAQRNAARARTASLFALAPKLGFDSFDPSSNPDFTTGWSFLGPFSLGYKRSASNIFRGSYHGEQMFIFDYHYETGSGKNHENHDLTMFLLIVKNYFPKVTLRPENLLLKIEGAFDSENIKFESAEFSRVYCVHSADKKFAYDVCNPQMIDYLLANRGLQIEIQGPAILLTFNPRLSPAQFEPSLQQLAQIRALLPQYLFTNS
jgi:hypothetical protein